MLYCPNDVLWRVICAAEVSVMVIDRCRGSLACAVRLRTSALEASIGVVDRWELRGGGS